MPNARHDNRLDGMETQPNQQRCRHRHRHAKPAHPLQEGGEKPAKQQALHGFVGGQRWQCAANHPHRPGFIGGVEEQQSRPDNVENIQREQDGFCLGVGNQFGAGAKYQQGKQHRRHPADRTGFAATPVESQHQHQDHQDGSQSQQPVEECELHRGEIILHPARFQIWYMSRRRAVLHARGIVLESISICGTKGLTNRQPPTCGGELARKIAKVPCV